jgi:CRISPR system Cascade subunit CasE
MTTVLSEKPVKTSAQALYLTQILISYQTSSRLHIRDSYGWHQRVWEVVGGKEGPPRKFLFRVDRLDENFRLLILSRSEPQLPEWCSPERFGTKSVPEHFFRHQRYRFSLLANPTRTLVVRDESGIRRKQGRRVSITNHDEIVAWIERKAEHGGFTINRDALQVIPRGQQFFRKADHLGFHSAVQFNGLLSVTDHDQFRSTISAGVGHGKAFGFGLLAVVPIS